MAASARQMRQLLDRMETPLQRAFTESVAAIKSRARIAELQDAISAGDIEAALYAAGIRDTSWVRIPEAIRNSYLESGQFVVGEDIPAAFGLEFDITNPRAQQWITQHSSALIVDITTKQRSAIQTIIGAGFDQGRNPRSIALDIAGRVSPQTGRRVGGVIGLHDEFAQAAINARLDLESLSNNYFSRTRRDQRFDSIVRRAIESGDPLPANIVDRIVGRYEDRLLQTRANGIARTEALSSMNAASDEAMAQVVDEGLAPPDAIERVWDSAGDDGRTRASHLAADGQRVIQGQPFIIGGVEMMYPGDPSAPVEEIANCRCIVRHEIDWARVD